MPVVQITRSTARRLALILGTVAALLVIPAAAEAKGCGWVGSLHVTASYHTSCGMARRVGYYIHSHRFVRYILWVKSPATGGWYRLHLAYDSASRYRYHATWVYRGRGLHNSLIKARVTR